MLRFSSGRTDWTAGCPPAVTLALVRAPEEMARVTLNTAGLPCSRWPVARAGSQSMLDACEGAGREAEVHLGTVSNPSRKPRRPQNSEGLAWPRCSSSGSVTQPHGPQAPGLLHEACCPLEVLPTVDSGCQEPLGPHKADFARKAGLVPLGGGASSSCPGGEQAGRLSGEEPRTLWEGGLHPTRPLPAAGTVACQLSCHSPPCEGERQFMGLCANKPVHEQRLPESHR